MSDSGPRFPDGQNMKIAEYRWTIVDDVMVAVGTDGKMPEDIWKTFVNEMDAKPIKKFIAFIIGSVEVSSVQRKICIDVINKHGIKVSIVNDSSIVRGIVTAASWFSVDVKSFAPGQLNQAVRELGVPTHRESMVIDAVHKLQQS
jgi:hypothetical protein